jgi:hypothetical protein
VKRAMSGISNLGVQDSGENGERTPPVCSAPGADPQQNSNSYNEVIMKLFYTIISRYNEVIL